MVVGEKFGKSESITLGQLFHRLQIYDDKLQKLMDKNMVEALNDFALPF